MEAANLSIWCWLIALLTGIIGIVIGYLWGRRASNPREMEEINSLRNINAQLQTELAAASMEHNSEELQADLPFEPATAKAAMGRRVGQDDLKLIEGIGPKIEGLFHNYDIKTWKALAETPVAKCREVLNSGGDRFKVHDPASWPMQARMAYTGQWKALARWQEEHKHGKL